MTEMRPCVVCDRVRPISRMRYGNYDREVGKDIYDGSSRRRGSSHGSSFGSSGGVRFNIRSSSGSRSSHSVRRRTRPVTGYACRYHGLLGRLVTRLVIVGVLLFFAYGFLINRFGSHHPARHQQTAQGSASYGADSQPRSEADQPAAEQDSSSALDTEAAPNTSRVAALAAALIADPASEPKVDAAMKEALATGEPQHWHVHKLHGYAVPSEADTSSCRMIQVSVDETGDKSSSAKLCP